MFIESMYQLQIIEKKKKKKTLKITISIFVFLFYFILFIYKNRILVLHYLNRSKYFLLFFFLKDLLDNQCLRQ